MTDRFRDPRLRWILTCCCIAIGVSLGGLAHADSSDTDSAEEAGSLTEMDDSLDLLFEEFDVVVSAGRTKQKMSRTSVPVSVLDSQDIHYSGAITAPELFDFIPSMDVLLVDRNRWATGVRGLHQEFSDRTLVLIDGRTASNPLYGGIDYFRLPLFLEDMERIEVVRGPGGAAWGANAFNGVINFINKSPRDTTGLMVRSTLNEFGDTDTHLRWGAADENLAIRLSLGLNETESSEDAITGTSFESRDFSRRRLLRFDAEYLLSESTTLDLGVGHAHIERGDFPFIAPAFGDDERIDDVRAYAKLSQDLGSGTSWYAQWYGTFQDVNRPAMWRYGAYDNTLDAQISFDAGDNHQLSVGTTWRLVRMSMSDERATDLIRDEVLHEFWGGGFVIDRWTISDRVHFENQLRLDWYSQTHVDWSGRTALTIALDDEGDHVLRFAGARAFRAPQSGIQMIETQRVLLPEPPFPANTYGGVLFQADDLDHELVWSGEVGYTGRLDEFTTLRIDGYFQWYENLTGAVTFPDPFDADRVIAQIGSLGDARAYGIETEITHKREDLSLSAWYAHNGFDYSEGPSQDARAFLAAPHKVGLRGRYHFDEHLTGAAGVRYTHTTQGGFGVEVDEYVRTDLSLHYKIPDTPGEISIGVNDLFDETALLVDSVGSTGLAHETPGRTFWVRFQMEF